MYHPVYIMSIKAWEGTGNLGFIKQSLVHSSVIKGKYLNLDFFSCYSSYTINAASRNGLLLQVSLLLCYY